MCYDSDVVTEPCVTNSAELDTVFISVALVDYVMPGLLNLGFIPCWKALFWPPELYVINEIKFICYYDP